MGIDVGLQDARGYTIKDRLAASGKALTFVGGEWLVEKKDPTDTGLIGGDSICIDIDSLVGVRSSAGVGLPASVGSSTGVESIGDDVRRWFCFFLPTGAHAVKMLHLHV